jgi:hypothetical protein
MQELNEGSAAADWDSAPDKTDALPEAGAAPDKPPAAATLVTQIAAALTAPISSLFLIVVSSRSLGA